ncbi:MAG: hypothetical protein GYA20_12260 [Chloroflexi bacterium]|nr:hypothetical protein [Chloroflexota bacterium]
MKKEGISLKGFYEIIKILIELIVFFGGPVAIYFIKRSIVWVILLVVITFVLYFSIIVSTGVWKITLDESKKLHLEKTSIKNRLKFAIAGISILFLSFTLLFFPRTSKAIQPLFFPDYFSENNPEFCKNPKTTPVKINSNTITPTYTITPTFTLLPTTTPTITQTATITPVPPLCISPDWKAFPNSYSGLVQQISEYCADFKELRFHPSINGIYLSAKPSHNTGIMGIYKMLPEGTWHIILEIRIEDFKLNPKEKTNQFFIGLINPESNKIANTYFEVYSRGQGFIPGRKFGNEPIQQRIEIDDDDKVVSDIFLECESTESSKTNCAITIDGKTTVFENLLMDEEKGNMALFIGYSLIKGSEMEIEIIDWSPEKFINK